MDNIQWQPADVKPHSVPRGKAYARITPNSITFNAVAASLIENIEAYPWAVVHLGTVDGKPAMLGFEFVREEVPNAFPVKKQSKKHKGVTFFSRELVKRYFGLSGAGLIYLQQDVEKVDDHTLAVKLFTEKDLGLDDVQDTLASIEKALENL